MLATYVKPVVTPLSLIELATSLRDGFRIVMGHNPTDQTLAVLMAKVRLESGNGQHCWNLDIGNIKRAQSDVGNYTCILLNEVIGGRVVWFRPDGELLAGPSSALRGAPVPVPEGHPQTRMASLANKTEAGRFYVDFVFRQKRYAAASQAAIDGNPEAYARLLGAEGYYTAPVEQYTKTVLALYTPSLALIRGLPHEEVQQPSRNEWHNQLVLDGFVQGEYAQLQDELNQGSGHAMREYETDTDPSELAPESVR